MKSMINADDQMKLISLREMPRDILMALLEELGYGTDGAHVIDSEGEIVTDRYIGRPVRLDNMLLLPGGAIFLDDNPVSIANYLEDFGDIF